MLINSTSGLCDIRMILWILSTTFWLINHFYYGFISCAQSISRWKWFVIDYFRFILLLYDRMRQIRIQFCCGPSYWRCVSSYKLFRDNENVTIAVELQSQFGGSQVLASSTYFVATFSSHRIKQCSIQISSIINLYLEFSWRLWLVISDHSTRERNFEEKHRRNYRKWCDDFLFVLLCARTQLRCARNFTESNQQINGDRVMWIYDYDYTASQQDDELKITNFIVNNQQEYHENVTHLLRTITAPN